MYVYVYIHTYKHTNIYTRAADSSNSPIALRGAVRKGGGVFGKKIDALIDRSIPNHV